MKYLQRPKMNISADMTDKIKHLQKGDCMVKDLLNKQNTNLKKCSHVNFVHLLPLLMHTWFV